VAAGRYTKVVSTDKFVADFSGKSGITVQGDPAGGTIIDASDHVITGGWSGPNAKGVYNISRPYSTYGQWLFITVDDGSGPEYVITGSADGYGGATFNPNSLWNWSDHINNGIYRKSDSAGDHTYYDDASCDGYDTLRGMAFHNATGNSYWPYSYNDGNLYLKLVDGNGDPLNVNNFTVKCSRKSMAGSDCGGFLLDGNADNITIRNIEFENGYNQIKIVESDGAVIEYCTFTAYKYGIRMYGDGSGTAGAGSVTVRYCELTPNSFSLRSGYTSKHFEFGALLWKAQKEFGDMDLLGIYFAGTKGGHHIHDNYLHDAWDGIGGGGPAGDWKNSEVNHNLIVNCLDDPIEIFGDCSNGKVHHNVSINSQQLTRIRATNGNPFYFYNNLLLRGPMTVQGILLPAGTTGNGTAYFYHNTIEGAYDNKCSHGTAVGSSIIYNQSSDATYDNWWWANNLYHGARWTKGNPSSPELDWQADYNVYCLNDNFAAWDTYYGGRIDTSFNPARYIDKASPDGHTVWSTSTPSYVDYDDSVAATFSYTDNYNVSLASGSPGLNAGSSNLPSLFGVGSLPGDLSNDCGAIAEGASMLVVPRWDTGPSLSSISPNSGSTAGGTACTLSGMELTGTTAVKFGGTSATGVSVVSANEVRCTSPSKSAGAYSVIATVSGEDTNGVTFTYAAAPTLSSINPNSGSTAGGTACTLTGANLTGCSSVSFGGTAATGIVVDSATQVRCASPAKTAGTIGVTATTPGGTSGSVNYTYAQGGGGTTTLTATKDGWAYSYNGGGYGGYQYTQVWKSSSHAKQTYLCFDISEIEGDVTSATLRLRVQSATSFSVGLSAYSVSNDTWAEGVNWASRPAETTPALDTHSSTRTQNNWYEWDVTDFVDAEVSAHASAVSFMMAHDSGTQQLEQFYTRESAYDPELVVVTSGGGGTPAPTLSSINPNSGTTAGGTACTLTGENLTGCSAVSFGANAATGISVVSDTQVRCTSPAGSGTVSVMATTSGGTSNGVNFTYTIPTPTLSSITPNTGSTAGGTACTLTGTNLTGCSAVSFGGTAATGIAVDSASQVRCTSPAKSAGAYGVTATTGGGTSNAVTFTYTSGGQSYTTTLTSSKDGWAYSYNGGGFGGYTYTQVWRSSSHAKQTYLSFDISSVPGSDVTSARLRLCVQSNTSFSVALGVYSVDNDTWAEGVNWASRPAETTPALDTHASTRTQNNWYEWDVTSFVDAEVGASASAVSFMMRHDSPTQQLEQFYTRESSNDPQLVVISQ